MSMHRYPGMFGGYPYYPGMPAPGYPGMMAQQQHAGFTPFHLGTPMPLQGMLPPQGMQDPSQQPPPQGPSQQPGL
jgi:hypothetical protein